MAFLTFSQFKIQSTTVAQPLLGSWITAGISAPSMQPITVSLGSVSNTTGIGDANGIFTVGDDVMLVDPGGLNIEHARISGLGFNTVTLGAMAVGATNPVTRKTHVSGAFGTGTFILPHKDVNNISVSFEDGATGSWLYVGNQWNMTATYRRISKLAKVASNAMPNVWTATENSPGNPFRTSELWTLGTSTNDLYNVTLEVA